MPGFHIFVSYARKDNAPVDASTEGWVTAFVRRLQAQHMSYAGKPLNVFFDTDSIDPGVDWRGRLREGLRQSRLFIAFLSPHYRDSEVCRWEFEEYLRLEHTLARGDGGVMPIFFVAMPEIFTADDGAFGPEVRFLVSEIKRRNVKFDLKDWSTEGADILRELDAEGRLAALRDNPQSDRDRKIITLADQMAAIDRAIAQRLDQVALAELAPGNITESYANFVGRARELRDLHTALTQDRIGLVGALHGLGGQGKTAVAVQYAYAYAGHYAAGGRWLLEAEGKAHLADALEPLAGLIGFDLPDRDPNRSDAENRSIRLQHILRALRERTEQGAAALPQVLADHGDIHTLVGDRPELHRHMLLVLDNVDRPELMTAAEAAGVAGEDWLQVVMTTRLDPGRFGAADERLSLIAVDDLPTEDAFALLARLRPFANSNEELAARQIVEMLGGFTLGVELVGAYLAAKPDVTYTGYWARLEAEGVTRADVLAEDDPTASRIRHRDKQVGRIVEDTLASLPEAAREILGCAAQFPPDQIVVDWLRMVVAMRLPELAEDQVKPGYPDPFMELMRDLVGRRLLPPSATRNAYRDDLEMVRLHRLVASHLEVRESEEGRTMRREAAETVCEGLALAVEHSWSSAPHAVAWAVAPLETMAERLHEDVDTAATARALSCLSGPVSRLGLMDRGMQLESASLETRKRLHQASPNDSQAARDLSISLERLASLLMHEGPQRDPSTASGMIANALGFRMALAHSNRGSETLSREAIATASQLPGACAASGDTVAAQGAMEQLRQMVSAYLEAGFEVHPQVAGLAARLGLSPGGSQSDGVSDEAVEAMLADDEVRSQLDAALKASGVEGGLAALSPGKQQDILRQMLGQSEGAADEAELPPPSAPPDAVSAPMDAESLGASSEAAPKSGSRHRSGGFLWLAFLAFLVALAAAATMLPEARSLIQILIGSIRDGPAD